MYHRCTFNDAFCSRLSPCDRCERVKDLELKKMEIEVESRYLEASARNENLIAESRRAGGEILARAIVENPRTSLGIGLGLLGVLGVKAYVENKKPSQRSQKLQVKRKK